MKIREPLIRPRRIASDDVDMTPMIDCVFLLLIFFVMAASFTVRGLDVDLPPAQTSEPVAGRVVKWELTEAGAFLLDGIPVRREDVPYELQKIVKSFRSEPGQIVLAAHPKAPVEALVFLVDRVRQTGGEKLLVATESVAQTEGGTSP